MQNLHVVLTERALAEYEDFEVTVPDWLRIILMDDLYYTITLITVCANSFAIGLVVGWLATL
jgi:hypothetical protein